MGRPPGAHGGNRRRGYPQEWELRESARYGERFEELDTEDDGQGVTLDSNGYALGDARRGDILYFDGYDLGQDRAKRGMYDGAYDDYFSEEEEEYYQDQRASTQAMALQGKQDCLLQSALDRIAKARAKGKTNVNLTTEEMEALERRGSQQPEPTPILASPPVTPAKSKIKTASRNSSTSSLAGKTRKKSTSGVFASPAKSNSKAKVTRKNSVEQAMPPYPYGNGPPGVMVQGPNGVPMYAPLYYGPPSPEFTRGPRSQAGSRSSSKHSRRETTPPEQLQSLPSPPRYYSSGVRPELQGSNRSFQDDPDWYPTPRTRSASNAQHAGYRGPDEYDMAPPMPAAQGRRHVSGPPDVRYASLRRAAPSSPLAQSAIPAQAGGSGPRRIDTSSSSSSDDQGVQVDIVPDEHGGYSIRNSPTRVYKPEPVNASASTPTKSGNEARKRKSGRK